MMSKYYLLVLVIFNWINNSIKGFNICLKDGKPLKKKI